ncbi:MAG: DMT family transporter [Pseudomonadota bacterium]
MDRPGIATILAVATIGLLWGLNWPAVKFMLTEMPPFTIRGIALSTAALLLGLYARMQGHILVPPWRELPWMALTGLLTIFGFNVLVALGQTVTETSKAAIIAYLMPALTAVFAALFLTERLDTRRLAALGIGMSGIAVLAAENTSDLIARPLGPAIMLASATVWALGTVAMKAGRFTLSPIALTVWFLGLSGLACWPFVLALEPPWEQSMPSRPVIAVLIWHAVLPMVMGYAVWTNLVGKLPAAVAAIATLMAPVVGVASSMILLGDPPGWHKFVALALILASIALTFLRLSRAQPAP